jgi:division protein CdvB (Snf7/Vps24/ESCRT-III family)
MEEQLIKKAIEQYKKKKDKSKLRYENNKEFVKARSSYNYYKKNDKLDVFKSKFPERVKILKEHANLAGAVVVGLDY